MAFAIAKSGSAAGSSTTLVGRFFPPTESVETPLTFDSLDFSAFRLPEPVVAEGANLAMDDWTMRDGFIRAWDSSFEEHLFDARGLGSLSFVGAHDLDNDGSSEVVFRRYTGNSDTTHFIVASLVGGLDAPALSQRSWPVLVVPRDDLNIVAEDFEGPRGGEPGALWVGGFVSGEDEPGCRVLRYELGPEGFAGEAEVFDIDSANCQQHYGLGERGLVANHGVAYALHDLDATSHCGYSGLKVAAYGPEGVETVLELEGRAVLDRTVLAGDSVVTVVGELGAVHVIDDDEVWVPEFNGEVPTPLHGTLADLNQDGALDLFYLVDTPDWGEPELGARYDVLWGR